MRYIICILFILQSASSFARVNNKDSIIKLLEAKIELGQTQQQKLDSLNIDLKNQLIIYKAKEDYFAVALGDQSNRFVLIVSLMFAFLIFFLGIISFSWYRKERQKIDKQFEAFGVEFSKIKEDNQLMNSGLYETSGNAHLLAAKSYRQSKSLIKALESNLLAIWENILSIKLLNDNDFRTPIYNLKIALEIANEITHDPQLKDELKTKEGRLISHINIIQDVKNEELRDLCAKIRVLIKDYLKQN